MDFMFHIPANAVLFFIILALAYRCAHIADEGVASEVRRCDIFISKPFLIPFFAGLLLILLFSEYAIFRRCHADMIFQRNKDEKVVSTGSYAALEYRRLFAEINNAITMNLGDSRYMCRKGDLASELILRRDLYDKLRIIGPLKNIDGMIVVADKSYSKAVTLNPTNADYHLKLGWLYSIAGDLDGMKKEFKKAWILDPTNINLRKYINEYMTELQQ
jgi:tetratricopeptide (TPR) repeat protein